jgi:uncharacterized protein (DUF1330 family)
MAAYLIVDITEIHDPQTYAQYRSQVTVGLEAAGGRYLVRGGAVDIVEGSWRPGRVVVVRFESAQAARRWWESSEYRELKRMRQAAASTNMIIVDGLA